ncbi:MAG: hypothetical protein JO353_03160 [Phycisphaerae bacterium]|nr:hypothetical protein [Phycisphaerae bacterium]
MSYLFHRVRFLLSIAAALLLTACAVDAPPPSMTGETIAQQLLRVAPMLNDAQQFSVLLNFESRDDALFVQVPEKMGAVVDDHAFTGQCSYRIESGAPQLSVKLSGLLAGRPFPGTWTMVGGYVFSAQPARVTLHFDSPAMPQSRPVDLQPNLWTPVFIDIPSQPISAPPPSLVCEVSSPHGKVWFDDVMLVDNSKSYMPAAEATEGWTVQRRGTQIIAQSAGKFNLALVSMDVLPAGWQCDEANPVRARFHSLGNQTITVYRDGRSYWNGEFRGLDAHQRDGGQTRANQTPASIEIAESMGRVDRNTPGDANNDGYNETTGSYRIAANGPRIELRFTPAVGVAVPRPVLEFTGLPFGKILVTLEGRLIEQSQRTSDGHVLIELPATIDRSVTVDVRIED